MSATDRIVSIEMHISTMDGCEQTTYFEVDANNKVSEGGDSGWSEEPDEETDEVELCFVHASGKQSLLNLDGDQHRDLEMYGLYDSLLARIVGGEDPDEALVEEIKNAQDEPQSRPSPRP